MDEIPSTRLRKQRTRGRKACMGSCPKRALDQVVDGDLRFAEGRVGFSFGCHPKEWG